MGDSDDGLGPVEREMLNWTDEERAEFLEAWSDKSPAGLKIAQAMFDAYQMRHIPERWPQDELGKHIRATVDFKEIAAKLREMIATADSDHDRDEARKLLASLKLRGIPVDEA